MMSDSLEKVLTEKQLLPSGWVKLKLSNAIEPRGEKISPQKFPDLPFIGMDHVEPHTTKILGSVPAREMKSNAACFYAGDVLYGRLRPYLNKVAQPKNDGLASAEFIVFSENELIKSSFLKYRLNAHDFVRFANHLNEGDRPRVSFEQIGDFDLLIPPPTEQERIANKLDELFSELDKGVENLRTAQQQLKVYRQALLKHAFEGKLTADWRAQNPDKLESAEALLVRIQKEREACYQQQLTEWREAQQIWEAAGKIGSKPAKPRVPKVQPLLTTEELMELPGLPEGWAWGRLGFMTCGVEYGTAAKSSETGKVAVLRMGNIQNSRFDWQDLVYTDDADEIAKYSLRHDDVLFNRTNSPELVGKAAIYKSEQPALFAGYLIRLNQIGSIAKAQFVNLFLASHVAKQHGSNVKTDGVNQSNINGEKLANYPFPYCHVSEQDAVVAVLEDKLSNLEKLESTITTSLQQAEALRQSILKKAFSGRLVPQHSDDEPASVLLERIRSERTAQQPARKRGRKVAKPA